MIRSGLMHPEILGALAAAGHGAKVLIADGLYPCSTGAHPYAKQVYLNLSPGLVAAADVLDLVAKTVHIEAAAYMRTAESTIPGPVQEFQDQLSHHRHGGGQPVNWSGVERHEFYAACREPDLCLLIATGEMRPYANLLLTIGVP